MVANVKLLAELEEIRLFFSDEEGGFIEAAYLADGWVQKMQDTFENLAAAVITPGGITTWLRLNELRVPLSFADKAALISLASELLKETVDLIPVLTDMNGMMWASSKPSEIEELRSRYRIASHRTLISLEALRSAISEALSS